MSRNLRTRKKKEGPEPAKTDQIFRCWVSIRDVRDGSLRNLPLKAFEILPLTKKKNEAQQSPKQVLRLTDDATTLEAKSLEDLTTQLRHRYPDEAYEPTLCCERDHRAEEKRREALNQLAELIARAAVRKYLDEVEGLESAANLGDPGIRRKQTRQKCKT